MKHQLFNVVKHQTSIKGYWKENNKIFIDNIEIIKYSNKQALKEKIMTLFNNGELAVFYTDNHIGIVVNKKGNKTILNKRIEFKYKKGYSNIQAIKDIIKKYGGCTVYSKKGYILIEVYTN